MYAEIARSILAGPDPAAIRVVAKVRLQRPRLSDEQVARRVTEQAAWRCAGVAAAAAAAGELLGRVLGAADLPYQVRSLNRLAGAVAGAHGRATTVTERAVLAGGCLGAAGAGTLVRRGAVRASRRLIGRRSPRASLVVSALAAGATAYALARLVGVGAEAFLSGRLLRRR